MAPDPCCGGKRYGSENAEERHRLEPIVRIGRAADQQRNADGEKACPDDANHSCRGLPPERKYACGHPRDSEPGHGNIGERGSLCGVVVLHCMFAQHFQCGELSGIGEWNVDHRQPESVELSCQRIDRRQQHRRNEPGQPIGQPAQRCSAPCQGQRKQQQAKGQRNHRQIGACQHGQRDQQPAPRGIGETDPFAAHQHPYRRHEKGDGGQFGTRIETDHARAQGHRHQGAGQPRPSTCRAFPDEEHEQRCDENRDCADKPHRDQ
ncbi:MAG: hypothetical protein P8Y58_15900, partial [Novosphingobium sp.]